MDFTFGIITEGNNDAYILIMIDSIKRNNIPNYEIIIVGNSNIINSNIIKIPFDETIRNGWITKKKNIIAEVAKYENIVLLHDYVKLNDNWYNGFLQFGNDFDWCITQIKTINGNRFRDYTLFPYKVDYLNIDYSPADIDSYFDHYCLLPYDFINTIKTNKYLYISGSYYIIKKHVALTHKLNEDLVWGKGEDSELSKRLHSNNIIIKINKHSCVSLLKQKRQIHWERVIHNEKLQKLVDYCEINY